MTNGCSQKRCPLMNVKDCDLKDCRWYTMSLDKNIINIEYNTDEKGNKEVSRFEYKLFSEALEEIGVPYIRFTFQRFTDKVWCVRVLTNNNTKFTHTYNVPTKNWPLIKVAKMGIMNVKGHIAEAAQMLTTYDFVIGDFLAGDYGSVVNMINHYNTEYAMDGDETLNADF